MSLIYIAVAMCPDIVFTVSALSKFLSNLGRVHWEAVKRILMNSIGVWGETHMGLAR